jgi:hypothetical protein
MTNIDLRGLRLSLERHLDGALQSDRSIRPVGAESYRVTGGRVRVRLTAERRFEIVVSSTAHRTSSRVFVRDIEADYQAALTAEVVRFLLSVGIGVAFTVTTAAFFRAVRTTPVLLPEPPDEWR